VHPDEHFQSLEPGVALLAALKRSIIGSALPSTILSHQFLDLPWDFLSVWPGPVRSLSFPLLFVTLPSLALHYVVAVMLYVTPFAALLVPGLSLAASRLAILALSVGAEWLLHHRLLVPLLTCAAAVPEAVARACARISVSLYALSWPVLVFSVRPFSNSSEAALLVIAAALAAVPPAAHPTARPRGNLAVGLSVWAPAVAAPRRLALGAVTALAVAIRPSFLAFVPALLATAVAAALPAMPAAPVMPAAPNAQAAQAAGATGAAGAVTVYSSPLKQSVAAAASLVPVALGATALLALVAIADSAYFTLGGLASPSVPGALAAAGEMADASPLLRAADEWLSRVGVISPLVRFLLYNSSPSAVATHGLHPRWTHVLVNVPLLFLPLLVALAGLWVLAGPLSAAAAAAVAAAEPRGATALLLLYACPFVLLLSLAPHQEPRFLLPLGPVLVAALAIAAARVLQRALSAGAAAPSGRADVPEESGAECCGIKLGAAPARFWLGRWLRFFLLFNGVLTAVFHVLHQGGLTSAVARLPNLTTAPLTHVFFLKTYPPPVSLLGLVAALKPAGAAPAPCGRVTVSAAGAESTGARVVCVHSPHSLAAATVAVAALAAPAATITDATIDAATVAAAAAAADAATGVLLVTPMSYAVAAGLVPAAALPVAPDQVLPPASAGSAWAAAAAAAGLPAAPAAVAAVLGAHLSLEEPPRALSELGLLVLRLQG
jgi:hypothetical protein